MPERAHHTARKAPHPIVKDDLCVKAKGATCNRCALACPHGAIDFTDQGLPQIDEQHCNGCGICYGICDAFSSPRMGLDDLVETAKRIASEGARVIFTCADNLASDFEPAHNVIVCPCLACLPPEFWTTLLAQKIPVSIYADLSRCVDCSTAPTLGEALFSHSVETAQSWTGHAIGVADTIPPKKELLNQIDDAQGYDRRGLFTGLVNDVADVATGKRRVQNSDVIQDFYAAKARMRAINSLNIVEGPTLFDVEVNGRRQARITPKRAMLLEAIEADQSIADAVTLYCSQTDEGRCTSSGGCITACPFGARYRTDDTTATDMKACIGCGICVQTCPNHALSIVERSARCAIDSPQTEEQGDR